MRVAIVGSRDYRALHVVRDFVRDLPPGDSVITGGARGVDAMAETQARYDRRTRVVIEPLFERGAHPDVIRAAHLTRNEIIARDCDRLVAFWDGQSNGTMHAVRAARKLAKPVTVFGEHGQQIEGSWSR